MKKYAVTIYYYTNIEVIIEAENEEQAKGLAFEEAATDKYDEELLGGLVAEGTDIVEFR